MRKLVVVFDIEDEIIGCLPLSENDKQKTALRDVFLERFHNQEIVVEEFHIDCRHKTAGWKKEYQI